MDTSIDDRKWRLRSLSAAAVGNALEWFDWTLYGTFSIYLARNLFNDQDPTSALLATFAVFAVGFVARPIGGYFFGLMGDRLGRKNTMVVTMCVLAVASFCIAILPTYSQVGVLSSVLLAVTRLVQGLAHGGESGVSYTYIAEISPTKRRGFWSSSMFVSVTIGVMVATALAAILTSTLGKASMEGWGWRVGFAVGGILGIYALYLRRSADESQVFQRQQTTAATRSLTTGQALRIGANTIMILAASNAAYYVWFTFAPSVAIATKGMNASGAYIASLGAQFACLFWMPVCGLISDRIGRKLTMAIWGVGAVVLTIPIATVVTSDPWTLFLAQCMGFSVWAFIAATAPAILSEQIPTGTRARGIGFISSFSVALFGGTAPYLNTWLNSIGHGSYYTAYVMVLGGLAVVSAFTIRETAGVDLNDIQPPREWLPGRRTLSPVGGLE